MIGFYDTTSEKFVVQATLPDSSYAGWGWGPSMTRTEMLIFSANGASSSMTTYYSIGEQEPTEHEDLASCYTTSTVANSDGTITITTMRPLDCGINNSYVIKLDTS